MAQLFLLTTPLGNPQDLSLRALDWLKNKKYFLVEDSRKFMALLRYFDIPLTNKKIETFHDHSDVRKIHWCVNLIKSDNDVTYASEAGSPIISDPAYPLVEAVIEEGITVSTLPGPSAPIAALELSGLAPIPFTFHGFIAREKSKKKAFLEKVKLQKGTHILFESAQRVQKTLREISQIVMPSKIAVMREMTKTFEQSYHFAGLLNEEELLTITTKGEFTIAFYCDGMPQADQYSELLPIVESYLDHHSTKDLAKIFAKILGVSSKEIYNKINN